MDNVFTYQSMTLPDFARAPKGTIAVFFCDWEQLQPAQNRITGKFKHASLPVKGTCTIKSFNSIDAETGVAFKVLHATVITPVPPLKKRGRPLGQKNKPKGMPHLDSKFRHNENGGITVMPMTRSEAQSLLDQHIETMDKGKVKLWPVY